MPPEPDAIWDLAQAVKGAITTGYATEGVDLPARQLVTPGQPAWDCELLAIHVESGFGMVNPAVQALEPQAVRASHRMRAIRVGITLVRCVPSPDDEGNPPSTEAEEDAAEVILNDAVLVMNSLIAAEKAGDLPGCSGLTYEDWTSLGPQGALAGGLLRVRLSVGV